MKILYAHELLPVHLREYACIGLHRNGVQCQAQMVYFVYAWMCVGMHVENGREVTKTKTNIRQMCLVLAPSRELAIQILKVTEALLEGTQLKAMQARSF